MEFLAWFEADGSSRGDVDFGSGAWIASDSGLSGSDGEDAEAAEFDSFALGESFFQRFNDAVNSGLRLGAWQACSLNHVVDDVLLDQGYSPFGRYRLEHSRGSPLA